jgi:hypothetical protein
MRSDYFGTQTLGKAPATSRMTLRPGRRNAKDPESDLEIPSDDSEDEDDDEDDDEEDEDDILESRRQAKATASGSSKGATTGSMKQELGEDDMEAYKQFLQFKMSKK